LGKGPQPGQDRKYWICQHSLNFSKSVLSKVGIDLVYITQFVLCILLLLYLDPVSII